MQCGWSSHLVPRTCPAHALRAADLAQLRTANTILTRDAPDIRPYFIPGRMLETTSRISGQISECQKGRIFGYKKPDIRLQKKAGYPAKYRYADQMSLPQP